MKLSTKIISGLLATSALALGISVQAQSPQGAWCDHGPGMGMMQQGKKMMGDPSARAEQRLAQFKSQLKIDAQQEPLWQAFAEKMKAGAGQGMKAMQGNAQPPMTAPERMTHMTNMMKERMAAMESTSESFKRLYDSLSPEQKAIADKQGVPGAGMMTPPADKRQGKGMPGRG